MKNILFSLIVILNGFFLAINPWIKAYGIDCALFSLGATVEDSSSFADSGTDQDAMLAVGNKPSTNCAGLQSNSSNSNSLILHYTFDGSLNDISGSGYIGENHGASLTTDRFGNPNSAFDFDGVDDWVDAGLNIKEPTGTISLWFKAETLEKSMLFCQIHHPYEASTLNYVLSNPTDGLGYLDIRGPENIQSGVPTKEITTLNKWHHLVCIWGEEGGRLYLDGALQGSSDFTYYDNTSTVNMGIGCYNGHHPRAHYFDGQIDDFRVYSKVISESEINSLYSEGGWQPGELNGLVASYSLNGDVSDDTGNGNDGEPYGPTPTEDRFGNQESAYQFDGVDDYIQLPTQQLSQISEGSFSCWFYLKDLSADNCIFQIGNTYTTNSKSSIVIRSDGSILFHYRKSSSPPQYWYESQQGVIIENEWYHFVLTQDKSNGIKMYLNSEEIVITYIPDGNTLGTEFFSDFTTNPNIATLGARKTHNYNDGFFNGSIDDIKIYDISISEWEVIEIYNDEAEIYSKTETLYTIGKYSLDPGGFGGIILGTKIIGAVNVTEIVRNKLLNDLYIEIGTTLLEITADKISENIDLFDYPEYITLCLKATNNSNKPIDNSDFVFLMEQKDEIPIGEPLSIEYYTTTFNDEYDVTPPEIGTIKNWKSFELADEFYSVYSLGAWMRRGLLDEEMIDINTIGVINGYTYQAGDAFMILRSFGSYTAASYIKMYFVPIRIKNLDKLPSIGSLIEVWGRTARLAIGDGTIRQKYSKMSSAAWVNTYVEPQYINILNGESLDEICYGTSLINVYEYNEGDALVVNFRDAYENAPDFSIKENSIIQYPEEYLEVNKKYTITSIIQNNGQLTGTIEVEFYYDAENQCELIGTTKVEDLIPGQEKKCSVDWHIKELYPDTYGIIQVYVRLKNASPQENNIENNIAYRPISVNTNGWTSFVNGFLDIFAQCPVHIEVIDPHNNIVNIQQNQIINSEYLIQDINDDGNLDQRVFIPNPDTGEYFIKIYPMDSYDFDDVYSLYIRNESNILDLEVNRLVSDIPKEPYSYFRTNSISSQIQRVQEFNSLECFPNPFDNLTRIKLPSDESNFIIRITDLTGRTVRIIKNISGNFYELSRDGLIDGIYLLELNGHKKYLNKILIQ